MTSVRDAVEEIPLRKITGLLVLASALLWSVAAGAAPFKAGLARIKVPDPTPFDVLVAYPTDSAEAEINESSYTVRASENAPVVSGTRFPIVFSRKETAETQDHLLSITT